MITKQALEEAIKACEGELDPDAGTAKKLAAYYMIKDKLYPEEQPQTISSGYSYAAPPVTERNTIDYDSETEFGEAVTGRETAAVLEIIDDLMSVLRTAQPRVYRRILQQIYDL